MATLLSSVALIRLADRRKELETRPQRGRRPRGPEEATRGPHRGGELQRGGGWRLCSIPGGSGKWLGRWCAGSLSLWRRSWRQRRAWRRLWWAGSIGGSSHHPRLLGLSSPGVCRPRGAALRPCAPRGHVELTLLCCCCGVSWAWIPSHNCRCVVLLSDRLQSPESPPMQPPEPT